MAAGAAETIIQSLFRARVVILIALAASMIVAVAHICREAPQAEAILRISAVLAGAAAIAFFHIRHFWLSVLAAIAPLPGLLVTSALAGAMPVPAASYALGLVVAIFIADDIAERVAEGVSPRVSAIGTLTDLGAVLSTIVAVGLSILLVLHWQTGAGLLALGTIAPVLAAIFGVSLAAPSLRFGESFVTGFNRVRERDERLVTPLLLVAHPRWGASVAGSSIVVCALGYFGSSSPGHQGVWMIMLLAVLIVTAFTFLFVRNWRRTCAVILSLVPAVLSAFWAIARLRERVDLVEITVVSLSGLALASFVAAQAMRYRNSGNDTPLASARAMERTSGIVVTAAVAAVFAMAVGSQSPVVPIVLLFFSALAAVLFQPAIAVSIETLFPRRETIEARYRVR